MRTFASPEGTERITTPEVGMPATYEIGSDRYPITIVSVSKSGHRIGYQKMHTRGGVVFVNDDQAEIEYAYRNKNGDYKHSCAWIVLGKREFYNDPSF